jgi:hypothetical protein
MSLCQFHTTTAITAALIGSAVIEENTYVSRSILPNGRCCGGYQLRSRRRTNPSVPTSDQTCTRGVRHGFVKAIHDDAGGGLDKKAVGGGKEGVGQGPGKMGRLPEAIERSKT